MRPPKEKAKFRSFRKIRIEFLLLPAVIIFVFAIMAFVEPRFFNRFNVANVLRNFSAIAFVALGQALVMIVGGFDLSVGAMVALASVVSAVTMVSVVSVLPDMNSIAIAAGFVAAFGACGLVGLLNGTLVATLKASPFIITMGTMSIVLGGIYLYTKGAPIYGLPQELVKEIGRGRLLGLPIIFFLSLFVIGAVWFIMAKMPLGRHIYAVGSNPRAAFESGINPTRILIFVYAMGGFLAACTGLIITARLGAGQSGIGTNAAIESIAAAVIAGVSLRGGIGRIPRVAMAALFLAVIANALNLGNIDSKLQTMVLGFFLIAAIAIERKLTKDVENE